MGIRTTRRHRAWSSARPILMTGLLLGAVLFSPFGLAQSTGEASGQATDAPLETDPDSGFVMAEGWQTVKGNCTVCHSAALVTQNRGSREHWAYLIDWMQETQGLWQFNPEMEATILDYLSTHYGPRTDARRQNLPKHLMPPTPQASETSAEG
ncbi:MULTISPECIES: hypothetical protein [unclassified Halomonas]|uniref:hypothetical protein n=1 Tax=unclassified Halomonas TaxID=2609666 RepID=UPI001964A972|nr:MULTISPECIES: hypothetical protein [unclassified Halomonas]MCO7216093.1 hypothetical protein [Halomonas sp. OfavH-34-E]